MKSTRSFFRTFGEGCRIAVFVIGLALACAPPAHAGGVVSTCDETHLRAALIGGGTVTFTCSGTITLTLLGGGTITILSDTTIDGTGQNVTISGGNAVGIFYVLGVKLNLNHLTITGGAGHFGGIENDGGTLVVSNSSFSGNNGSEAGAIENDAGMLTVRNSTFMGNSGGEGGAIENDGGTLVVSLTKFSGNRSGYGGGIMNRGSGTGTVRSSTFTGNIAQIDGGGIENDGATLTTSDDTFSDNMGDEGGGIENDGGNCTVRNSTFTNNTGVSVGGGIESAFGSLTLINSTLAGNASGEGGAIAANLYSTEPSTLTLSNTIVVNGCVNSGTLIDGSGNLNWQASACPGIHVDPKLDPSGLLDNGGPTQTMALDTGSPAIGAAVEANCPISDQRGFPRPFTSACSIGAFEPGVLFGSFQANGIVNWTSNAFAVAGTFSLGDNNGISPPTELVQLRFGNFSTTISNGSFQPKNGGFAYVRFVNGVPTFAMTIQPLGGNKYFFGAAAQSATLTGTANPVTVQVTVGDDGGTTTTQARFF